MNNCLLAAPSIRVALLSFGFLLCSQCASAASVEKNIHKKLNRWKTNYMFLFQLEGIFLTQVQVGNESGSFPESRQKGTTKPIPIRHLYSSNITPTHFA